MISYCAQQVRGQDVDRFHLTLLAPQHVQEAWLTLAAFNLEIARTATRVSEASLGQIRLQWWREAVEEIARGERVRAHQVPLALAAHCAMLPPERLLPLIDAREADLLEEPFADFETMTAYLIESSGAMLRLQAETLGLSGAEGLANHLGCAWGFIGWARALASGRASSLRLPGQWYGEPLAAIAGLCARALMHQERAAELAAELPKGAALRTLMKTERLCAMWQRRLRFKARDLGQDRFARALPLQMLRLSF